MASVEAYSLEDLARALTDIRERKLGSQQQIGVDANVEQPTVSKAKNGKLQRKSEKTDRLMLCVREILNRPPLNQATINSVHKFYSIGGTDKELEAIISHGADLISRRFTS